MGCHPSHWRTPSFFKRGRSTTNQWSMGPSKWKIWGFRIFGNAPDEPSVFTEEDEDDGFFWCLKMTRWSNFGGFWVEWWICFWWGKKHGDLIKNGWMDEIMDSRQEWRSSLDAYVRHFTSSLELEYEAERQAVLEKVQKRSTRQLQVGSRWSVRGRSMCWIWHGQSSLFFCCLYVYAMWQCHVCSWGSPGHLLGARMRALALPATWIHLGLWNVHSSQKKSRKKWGRSNMFHVDSENIGFKWMESGRDPIPSPGILRSMNSPRIVRWVWCRLWACDPVARWLAHALPLGDWDGMIGPVRPCHANFMGNILINQLWTIDSVVKQ